MKIEDLIVGEQYNIHYVAEADKHSYHGPGTYIRRRDKYLYFNIPEAEQKYDAVFYIEHVISKIQQPKPVPKETNKRLIEL